MAFQPAGFTLARIAAGRRGLLHRDFTLTPPRRGGIFSVALSGFAWLPTANPTR